MRLSRAALTTPPSSFRYNPTRRCHGVLPSPNRTALSHLVPDGSQEETRQGTIVVIQEYSCMTGMETFQATTRNVPGNVPANHLETFQATTPETFRKRSANHLETFRKCSGNHLEMFRQTSPATF